MADVYYNFHNYNHPTDDIKKSAPTQEQDADLSKMIEAFESKSHVSADSKDNYAYLKMLRKGTMDDDGRLVCVPVVAYEVDYENDVYTKEAVEDIYHTLKQDISKSLITHGTNHQGNTVKAEIESVWLTRERSEIDGLDVPANAIAACIRIYDEEVRKAYRNGEFNGVSIEAKANIAPYQEYEKNGTRYLGDGVGFAIIEKGMSDEQFNTHIEKARIIVPKDKRPKRVIRKARISKIDFCRAGMNGHETVYKAAPVDNQNIVETSDHKQNIEKSELDNQNIEIEVSDIVKSVNRIRDIDSEFDGDEYFDSKNRLFKRNEENIIKAMHIFGDESKLLYDNEETAEIYKSMVSALLDSDQVISGVEFNFDILDDSLKERVEKKMKDEPKTETKEPSKEASLEDRVAGLEKSFSDGMKEIKELFAASAKTPATNEEVKVEKSAEPKADEVKTDSSDYEEIKSTLSTLSKAVEVLVKSKTVEDEKAEKEKEAAEKKEVEDSLAKSIGDTVSKALGDFVTRLNTSNTVDNSEPVKKSAGKRDRLGEYFDSGFSMINDR